MGALTVSGLLDAWERGRGLSLAEQALLFASYVDPDASLASLAALPLGQRDRLLFGLRSATFGSALPSTAICASCGETVEFDLDVAELTNAEPPVSADAVGEVDVEGRRFRFRLPNTLDLMEASNAVDPESALLTACLGSAAGDVDYSVIEAPSPAAAEAIARQMADMDGLADVSLQLTCAVCGHEWDAVFDIVTYLGRELDTWARALMGEVARLATAYGWTEQAALAIGPHRRRYYLDLAGL